LANLPLRKRACTEKSKFIDTCAFGVPGATDLSEKAVWQELETVKSVSDVGRRRVARRCVTCRLLRQDLYFCTSKASKLSSSRLQSEEPEAQYLTFVPVKQANRAPRGSCSRSALHSRHSGSSVSANAARSDSASPITSSLAALRSCYSASSVSICTFILVKQVN
jgi:hypothetical protein